MKEREAWCAAAHGVTESDLTEQQTITTATTTLELPVSCVPPQLGHELTVKGHQPSANSLYIANRNQSNQEKSATQRKQRLSKGHKAFTTMSTARSCPQCPQRERTPHPKTRTGCYQKGTFRRQKGKIPQT